MSCLVHTCVHCGFEKFDNLSAPIECPRCNAGKFYTSCDDADGERGVIEDEGESDE